MSNSPPFYASSSSNSSSSSRSSSKSPVSTFQANNNTYEPSGSSCQQMAETKTREGEDVGLCQREGVSFSPRAAAVSRQHSVDAALTSGLGSAAGQGPVRCLHPYQRQFSDGAVMAAGRLPQGSSSLGCLQESSYPDVPAAPVEPSCFSSQNYPYYRSSSPLKQIKRMYPKKDPANSSKYSVSTLQSRKESAGQSSFSKPVYSYSILIFMALKSSKMGSLPVSEIYGFMTENFPYFKTAPDGWKNSVRHNLSLNKCFVKVENKNGNSSRKGCLWALNPAKVEKMQEELHKWRRKDPVSVRRSMARPECLDRLLGEKPDKLRSFPPYLGVALSRVPPVCNPTSTSCPPALLQPSGPSAHHHHVQSQQPCYLSPPAAAHPSSPFALYSPCGQPPAPGSLNSPMAGKMPPDYSAALQAEYSFGPRSIQDFLLEGDSGYDIDTLNPSLTDLQLQGNLWEELREDSLVTDPQVTTTTCFSTSALQDQYVQTSCLHAAAPPVCQRGEEREDRGSGFLRHTAQYDCMNGFHPAPHSGYVTSCTTSVSLM